jgi:class 3 adenylate cyclase
VTRAEIFNDDGDQVAVGHQTAVLRERVQGAVRQDTRRTLTTLLFTDIVESTSSAERIGDARWGELLAGHNDIVRRELRTFRGREIKTTGDGFLAVFDSPARAVHCARAIRDGVRRIGIELRAGLHTGECDLVGDDVSGIAVAIAARIQAAAGPNEILVSSTVRDLVVGSGLPFVEHGVHALKGVEGEWHLYTVGS